MKHYKKFREEFAAIFLSFASYDSTGMLNYNYRALSEKDKEKYRKRADEIIQVLDIDEVSRSSDYEIT